MALQPDLVMFELALRAGSGLALITTLQKHQPGIPILVVSMFDEGVYAERVLRAGAQGYIMTWEATDVMLDAISPRNTRGDRGWDGGQDNPERCDGAF